MTDIHYLKGAISPFDCVGNAWAQVTGKFGLYLGMGFVAILLISCIPILNIFLVGPVMGGFYYVALKDMRGEPIEFGMLFRGFDKFIPLMVIGIIQSIPSIIFQIIQTVGDITSLLSGGATRRSDFFQSTSASEFGLAGGVLIFAIVAGVIVFLLFIAWYIAFKFAIPIAMEHDVSITEAISLSFRASFSNIGGLIVMLIFAILIAFAGVLALCIGIFVAVPVLFVADAFAYRQVFPMIEQRMNFNPPPPTAYGSSFGSGS